MSNTAVNRINGMVIDRLTNNHTPRYLRRAHWMNVDGRMVQVVTLVPIASNLPDPQGGLLIRSPR